MKMGAGIWFGSYEKIKIERKNLKNKKKRKWVNIMGPNFFYSNNY